MSPVTIDGEDCSVGYTTLARSSDLIGGTVFAALTDRAGKVVKSEDGSDHVSVDADSISLLHIGDKIFSVTHLESRPGAMHVSELAQDADGNLTPVSTRPVVFSDYGGLWVPCAGSVTPRRTHLGSEEYPAEGSAKLRALTAITWP